MTNIENNNEIKNHIIIRHSHLKKSSAKLLIFSVKEKSDGFLSLGALFRFQFFKIMTFLSMPKKRTLLRKKG